MSARDRLAALAWLTDRAYGNPAQPVSGQEVEPTDGKFTVDFVESRLCPKCGHQSRPRRVASPPPAAEPDSALEAETPPDTPIE